MKKIVVILGSPRKKGNSTVLADKAIEGIVTNGGMYDVFYLNGMNIRPCQGCYYCQHGDHNRCFINDDMQMINTKLSEADALLIASPIYMFSVSAQLKLFMDRSFPCLYKLTGKKVGILLTYGDPDEKASGVFNAINTLKDEYSFTKSEIIGIVHGSADEAGEIIANGKLIEEAYELGKRLSE